MTNVLENIALAISKLDSSDHAKALVTDALSQSISPTEIVEMGIRRGLQIVGEKYEAKKVMDTHSAGTRGSTPQDDGQTLVIPNIRLSRKGNDFSALDDSYFCMLPVSLQCHFDGFVDG